MNEEEGLTGSEQFLLLMTAIASGTAIVGVVFQFILKSRCTHLQCCCISCDRDVLPPDQSILNTRELENVASNV